MEQTRFDARQQDDEEKKAEADGSFRERDIENGQERRQPTPGQHNSIILILVCISIVVVSPMLLIIERGVETAASSLLLVAVPLIKINSVVVGGAASRLVGLILACLSVAMFVCSLVEEFKPEKSERNSRVDRGQCVNSSKDWRAQSVACATAIFGRTASST